MFIKISTLNEKLKAVHRRFLENERQEAEKILERRLSAFEFVQLLTTDSDFAWLRPLSTLIANIDACLSQLDGGVGGDEDAMRIWNQVDLVLHQSDSKIRNRFLHYLNQDAEFVLQHSQFHTAWTQFNAAVRLKTSAVSSKLETEKACG